jgi:glycogen operon protein
VEGIGTGQHYGFVAWGPNWTEHKDWYPGSIHGFVADVDNEGNRFNPNKLLMDPYAVALHRDHDWLKGSAASGPGRTQSTYAAATKSVVMTSDYTWSDGESEWRQMRQDENAQGHGWEDQIVYEVHLKGFTANAASGVDHPGTFRGMGEKAEYFKDLGITAVELLPIHEKPLDGGYWGYWTTNFFAPELSYASDQDPYEVLNEFKWMVDQMHQQGIEVWVDVVYNHTGEGGLWRERIYQDDFSVDPGTDSESVNLDPKEVATLFSFRGLDNQAYYALTESNQEYWNNTGVGNETRANHKPMRRLIMDSLRFYVEELHVDGFRFDLAGILGQRDMDYNNWDDPANTVLQDIIDDPVLQKYNTRVIAEPWTAGGNYGPLIGAYPNSSNKDGMGWGEWNARFRDWWRAFFNQDEWKLESQEADADGGFVMTACDRYYSWNGRRPYHSVNFITAHDGFTLYDLFSYNEKRNKCGPLNPVCCDDPASSWCEQDSGDSHNRSRDWGQDSEHVKRQMMRNAFVAMLISHGTPMLLGGDEWMRSQLGNNNAYSTGADNEWNWYRWGEYIANDERHRMHDFVRQMIRVRKAYPHAFTPTTYGGAAPFSWRNAGNTGDPDWGSKNLMLHYYDPAAGPELAILINMERNWTTFTLPEGRTWQRLIDTQSYFDLPAFFDESGNDPRTSANASVDNPQGVGANYDVAENTIVILVAE